MDEQRANHLYRRRSLPPGAPTSYRGMPVTQVPLDEAEESEYDDVWPVRVNSSARRYQGLSDVPVARTPRSGGQGNSVIPPRSHMPAGALPEVVCIAGQYYRVQTHEEPPAQQVRKGNNRVRQTEDDVPIRSSDHLQGVQGQRRPRFHWLVFVGIALFTMLVGWILLTVVSSWWQVTTDDWHYGRPRTYQTDQVVGHNDSLTNPSHFIVLNIKSHIEIIEFPGGDASKAKIYVGPTLLGDTASLAAVTLTFRDVNGDGKLDMVVNVQDSHFVFINDNGQFRPARPGENVTL